MPSKGVLAVKQKYNDRLCKLLDEHERAFLVHADNVGSRQFMDIRTVRVLPPPPDVRIFLGFWRSLRTGPAARFAPRRALTLPCFPLPPSPHPRFHRRSAPTPRFSWARTP